MCYCLDTGPNYFGRSPLQANASLTHSLTLNTMEPQTQPDWMVIGARIWYMSSEDYKPSCIGHPSSTQPSAKLD